MLTILYNGYFFTSSNYGVININLNTLVKMTIFKINLINLF